MADRETDVLTGTETTGHEWDGIKEAEHAPAQVVALHLLCDHRVGLRLFRALSGVAVPRRLHQGHAGLFVQGRDRRNHGSGGGRPRRLGGEVRRHPGGGDRGRPRAPGIRHGRRQGHLRRQLPALPRRRRVRSVELSGAGRRRLAVGGNIETIYATVQHGIRSVDGETRVSEMPHFGADNTLTPKEIATVADYVLSLSGTGKATEEGATLFADKLRRLPRRGRQGDGRTGRPQPDRRHLALRRRQSRRRRPGDGSPSRGDAGLERAPQRTYRSSRCPFTSIRWAAASKAARRRKMSP